MVQKVVNFLNNKYLLAIIALLFLLGVARTFKK
jgi:hypothetical protein